MLVKTVKLYEYSFLLLLLRLYYFEFCDGRKFIIPCVSQAHNSRLRRNSLSGLGDVDVGRRRRLLTQSGNMERDKA